MLLNLESSHKYTIAEEGSIILFLIGPTSSSSQFFRGWQNNVREQADRSRRGTNNGKEGKENVGDERREEKK